LFLVYADYAKYLDPVSKQHLNSLDIKKCIASEGNYELVKPRRCELKASKNKYKQKK